MIVSSRVTGQDNSVDHYCGRMVKREGKRSERLVSVQVSGHMRCVEAIVGLLLGMLLLCGCGGGGTTRQQGTASTPSAYVAKVEHQCSVAYMNPKVRGEPLGFTCGEVSTGQHFGAIYTRRTHCRVFITIVVDVGKYRRQGCMSSTPRRLSAGVVCESVNTPIVGARTQPQTQSATVRLSTGRESTVRVLSLDAADRARWGGLYFNVLAYGPPTNAILIERDQARRAIRRVPIAFTGLCPPWRGRR